MWLLAFGAGLLVGGALFSSDVWGASTVGFLSTPFTFGTGVGLVPILFLYIGGLS